MKLFNIKAAILLTVFGWFALAIAGSVYIGFYALLITLRDVGGATEGIGIAVSLVAVQLIFNYYIYCRTKVKITLEPLVSMAIWGLVALLSYKKALDEVGVGLLANLFDALPRMIAKSYLYAAIMYAILVGIYIAYMKIDRSAQSGIKDD